jgi:hypothetical protein
MHDCKVEGVGLESEINFRIKFEIVSDNLD